MTCRTSGALTDGAVTSAHTRLVSTRSPLNLLKRFIFKAMKMCEMNVISRQNFVAIIEHFINNVDLFQLTNIS